MRLTGLRRRGWSTAVLGAVLALGMASPAAIAAPQTAALQTGALRTDAVFRAGIHFEDIHCFQTEDDAGADEAYLKVNGVTKWAAGINNGQTLPLDFDMVLDRTTLKVELWDDDGDHWYDRDDWLGENFVTWEADKNGQSRSIRFTNDGATYEVRFSTYVWWE